MIQEIFLLEDTFSKVTRLHLLPGPACNKYIGTYFFLYIFSVESIIFRELPLQKVRDLLQSDNELLLKDPVIKQKFRAQVR